MPTDAELVELEARRAELRETYLLPVAERRHPGPRHPSRRPDLLRRRADDPVLPGPARLPAGRAGREPRLPRARRTSSSTSGNQTLLGFFDFPGLGLEPGIEAIGGVQHIAISVPRDRWEQLRDRLDAAGVTYVGPDLGIEESMYFKDPDGIQIELLSDPLMYFGGRQLDE